MVIEILTEWTVPSGGNGLTVMFAEDETVAVAARNTIADLWSACEGGISDEVSWSVQREGRIMDTNTGVLTGFWNDPTDLSGSGVPPSAPVANATQVLFRWNTGSIVDGRVLRGRTYMPGCVSSAVLQGELGGGVYSDFQTAAGAFGTANTGVGVWHRPVAGSGGSFARVVSGTVWQELAVQRKRRS